MNKEQSADDPPWTDLFRVKNTLIENYFGSYPGCCNWYVEHGGVSRKHSAIEVQKYDNNIVDYSLVVD